MKSNVCQELPEAITLVIDPYNGFITIWQISQLQKVTSTE